MLLIEDLLKNKLTYILIVLIIIIYSRQTQIIIDFPKILNYMIFVFIVIILFIINFYYEKRKKEKKNFWVNLFTIIFFSLFFTFAIKIPLNIIIINSKENIVFKEDCKIINFISGRFDRIAFLMNNKVHEIGYNNDSHLTRTVIRDDYLLRIEYNNSLFDTKVIKEYSLVKK
ncbi:hypothetical protein [Chryseobacterium gambrini]|uniref:hypothetical protein n=1 Tax=Chryseobacterium gambrini TaxID=373672 RepID=UPI0022F3B73F|nr:hypothetical protein [Chryseobacterium gambrini]WBX99101.1 hypothetical protein PE065_07560 [Chryseobacterium gambrini]